MADRLEIPPGQKAALARILHFSQKERASLVDLLKESEPSILGRKFVSGWVQKAKVPETEAAELFQLLASMYVSMDLSRQPTEKFVEDVTAALKASGDSTLRPKDGDWGSIQSFLSQVFSLETTFGVSAKATDIRSEYKHVFCTARILTDLRPVYGRDVEERPSAGVVVHEAKITYHDSGEEQTKDFYVALDNDDIQQLKKLLDRATRKEASLKTSARKGGINVLEP